MSFAAYLRDHAALCGLCAAAYASAAVIAVLCGLPPHAIALTCVLLVLGLAAGLSLDWLRRRRYLRELATLPALLERPWQLASLVHAPDQRELRIVDDALHAMEAACADEVADAHKGARDYRAYVEAWIHEVKAPLAAAGLAAQRVGGEGGAALTRELERVEAQVEQALWYARSTAPEADYAIREQPLAPIVRTVLKSNARLLIEQGVTPQLSFGDAVHVPTDEKWAGFVIAQIVVNAAKYGAHTLMFTTEERPGTRAGAACVLTIADDGRGIPAADVPRVFERGFVGSNGRGMGTSTGIGLYLAAVMCEKMGLGIELASEEGVGTRVMLAFPHE